MQNRLSYPELYLPYQISRALSQTPALLQAPTAPVEPAEPKDPGIFKYDENVGCFAIGAILVLLLNIWIFSSDKASFTTVSLGIFLFIMICGNLYGLTISDRKYHKKQLAKYREDIKKYPAMKKKYEEELILYKKEKERYEHQVERILSKANIEHFRAELVKHLLQYNYDSPDFQQCEDCDVVKKGASESFFIEYLSKGTDWKIYENKKVPAGQKFYYPDIILEINGLFFDIEIDEPYSGNDGTPIHYVEGFRQESVDKNRNDYMLSLGWIVIRFSEEQIFLKTSDCMNYIYIIYSSIINGVADFQAPANLSMQKWTKEDAYKMAYLRFRNKYIPKQYLSFIDKEDFRSYSELKDEFGDA